MFLDTLYSCWAEPTAFYRSLKPRSLWEPFRYWATVLLIPAAITLVWQSLTANAFVGLGAALLLYFSLLVAIPFTAALTQIFVHLLGGKKGYVPTFHAEAYAATPVAILLPIPYLNIVGILWSVYLNATALRRLQGFTFARGLAAVLLSVAVPLAFIAAFAGLVALTFAPFALAAAPI